MMKEIIWELTTIKRLMKSLVIKHYAGPGELRHKDPRGKYWMQQKKAKNLML